MKIIMNLSFLIILLLLFGCKEESLSPIGNFSVSGVVLSEGIPVEGAIVKISGEKVIQTQTDNSGGYKLLNVPGGNHELTVSKNIDGGGFTERTTAITVEDDLVVDNLVLPIGVRITNLQDVTDRSLKITWSKTDAYDFREYKLYQHNTSGLDETTGTLVHVSTEITDTSFTINNLTPLTQYYFRVYVMNDFGRLGGSNIQAAETRNLQVIKNGSFEILDPNTEYPLSWQSENFGTLWLVDSNVVFDGKYSLSVHDQSGVIMPWQSISPNDLVAGSRYNLSYWIKHDALQSPNMLEEFSIYLDNTEFTWHIQINPISGPQPESDWKEYIYEFTMPSVTASNFNIRLYFLLAPDTYAWIDKISLEKVL